jgi:hypothetical protein
MGTLPSSIGAERLLLVSVASLSTSTTQMSEDYFKDMCRTFLRMFFFQQQNSELCGCDDLTRQARSLLRSVLN